MKQHEEQSTVSLMPKGNKSSYAQIFEFNDPWFFDVMVNWDRPRYDKSHILQSFLGIQRCLYPHGFIFVIDGIFKYLFYKLRITVGETGYIILSMVVLLILQRLMKGWGHGAHYIIYRNVYSFEYICI